MTFLEQTVAPLMQKKAKANQYSNHASEICLKTDNQILEA